MKKSVDLNTILPTILFLILDKLINKIKGN